ncbi:hypothetical protein SNUCP2_27440 [Clostridium perfringens A]|uniref:hypothetical protein n=1 Tax=Clostridium perfringens TaxID=1502 RepID=UPI001B83DCBD|nr:hypothetical protein [Clostridium perfringens]HBC2032007.1 hypothetical protein [Clostridium perfringens]HBC2055742.1 hypothetical protein [Clostridium perfringens]HBC2069358.1 hypothetical protein [Clostridium perfringens]
MSIEKAYSIEANDIIDAEEAYELYWNGIINDKKAFSCIYCDAQITCANLDKKRAEMKNLPHFKCCGSHGDECKLILEISSNKRTDKKRTERNFLDEDIDELNIIHNTEGIKKIINKKENKELKNIDSQKEKVIEEYKSGKRRKSKYTLIRPIVSKYIKYNKENLISKKYINVYKNINITYEEMFKKIDEVDIENLSKYKRIYFGEGNIKKVENGYMVAFNKRIKIKDDYIKTTFFINYEKHLKDLNNLQQFKEELDEIVEKQEKIMIYVYTNNLKLKVNNKNTNKEMKIINLYLDMIECFDYRKL